jgi:hypothetical protein
MSNIQKFLPIVVSILILYFVWCAMKPSISYQSIKSMINDLHTQDAFSRNKINDDKDIQDKIGELADSKGIYSDELDLIIDREKDNRIKKITINYKDYIRLFGFEIITRNYTYESKLKDRRQSL